MVSFFVRGCSARALLCCYYVNYIIYSFEKKLTRDKAFERLIIRIHNRPTNRGQYKYAPVVHLRCLSDYCHVIKHAKQTFDCCSTNTYVIRCIKRSRFIYRLCVYK